MRADASLVNIKKNVIGHQMISTGFVKVVVHNLRPIYAQPTPNLRPIYAQVDVLWKLSRELQGQIRTHQMAKKTQKILGYDK